jgi:hypothetical protein
MPAELKDNLFESLKLAISDFADAYQFKTVDSSNPKHPFKALHFQSAARYGPDVRSLCFHGTFHSSLVILCNRRVDTLQKTFILLG